MHRQIAPGVEWVFECYEVAPDLHMHDAAFVVDTDGGAVVVDTGSRFNRRNLLDRVDVADDPAAVILSKGHLPHAANVHALQSAYDLEVRTSAQATEIVGLPDAEPGTVGSTMTVAGARFTFVKPPLKDVPHSAWIYAHGSGTLFSADGFGCYHRPGDCERTADEYPGGLPGDLLLAYHRDTLAWLRYADPERVVDAIDECFDERAVERVAPNHGPPVPADGVPSLRDAMRSVVETLCDEFEPPGEGAI